METPKLIQESVAAVPSRRVTLLRLTLAVGLIFFASSSVSMCDSLHAETDRRIGAQNWALRESRAREVAESRLEVLSATVREMKGDAFRFRVASEAGHALFGACMEDPSALVFSPEVMGWVAAPMIRFHNPVPLSSDPVAQPFLPGEQCWVAPAARLSIRRRQDVFVVRLAVSSDDSYAGTCPDGTYVIISDKNEIVQDLVMSGCLKAAAALELGLLPR